MENLSRPLRELLRYFFIYLVVLGMAMALFWELRTPWLLAVMWLVAIGGLVVLGVQASRLLNATEQQYAQAEARLETFQKQTVSYKQQIEQFVKKAMREQGSANATHMEQLLAQVNTWTVSIADLIDRVNRLRQDPLIQRDLQTVPHAIASLQERINADDDETIRAQLARTLDNRQKQLTALQGLQKTMRRAEIQIESTVSMLGTIYSQLLTSQSTSHVADYSHLAADVSEEVLRLQDHLEALREVTTG